MRTLPYLAIVAVALGTATAHGDNAHQDNDAQIGIILFDPDIDTSYEVTRDRLEANGYRDVRRLDGSAYRLSAFEKEGAEVLLKINPRTGEVAEVVYAHPTDQ